MSDRADALVLFGITGDLAAKKLFTSLYNLACRGLLPEVVVGVARSEWDLDTLREHARGALEAAGVEVREQVLAGALAYVGGDYREPDTFARLRDAVGGCERVACYLAIPPALFGDVVEGLAAVGLNEGGRVILEKPSAVTSPRPRSSTPPCTGTTPRSRSSGSTTSWARPRCRT
jgi:glucose-6-phosphate 1-dehydrogenase